MEAKNLYRHKKSGKLYSLISDNFMFKDLKESKRIYTADSFEYEWEDIYDWRRGLILYKAEYDCPDGPFFARCPEDFYKEFEKVDE